MPSGLQNIAPTDNYQNFTFWNPSNLS